MKTFRVIKDIEVDTYIGIDGDQEAINNPETIKEGEEFDEDDIFDENEYHYCVQWGNGDVSVIPKSVVELVFDDGEEDDDDDEYDDED